MTKVGIPAAALRSLRTFCISAAVLPLILEPIAFGQNTSGVPSLEQLEQELQKKKAARQQSAADRPVSTQSSAASTIDTTAQIALRKGEIEAAAAAADAPRALAAIDELNKIWPKSVPPETPMLLIEAKMSASVGNYSRAEAAVTRVIQSAAEGSAPYKEAQTMHARYQLDAQRRALIARIPEVLRQMRESLVEIPDGQFSCPAKNFVCKDWNGRHVVNVRKFRVTKCDRQLWWAVFMADTGRPVVSAEDFNDCSDSSNIGMLGMLRSDFQASETDLAAFVAWVSAHDGGGKWRLPTEAELGLIKEQEAALYPVLVGKQIDERLAVHVHDMCIAYDAGCLRGDGTEQSYVASDCFEFTSPGHWRWSPVCEKKKAILLVYPNAGPETFEFTMGGQSADQTFFEGPIKLFPVVTPGDETASHVIHVLLVREG
jgi:formylglycine-generating enzyme required for sulfatase activity